MERTFSNDSSADYGQSGIPVLQTPASYQKNQVKELTVNQKKVEDPSVTPSATRKNEIFKDLHRGTPTDDILFKRTAADSHAQKELAKLRNQYYNDAFGFREPYHTSRHRVNQDSIVVVEIKTNLEVDDASNAISDLTHSFAQIFQRPESSMLIFMDHNKLLRLGPTSEPAYLMKVSALPNMIAPTMNKRHTALIQSSMEENLGISQDRGVIQFEAMLEENFATNGATIKDEIAQMDRTSHDENGFLKSISRTMTRKNKSTTAKVTIKTAPNHSRLSSSQRTSDETGSLKPTIVSSPEDTSKKIKKYKSLAKLFSH